MIGVFFDPTLDAIYKYNRFFKTLLEKNFKSVLNRKDSIVTFYLSFVLLLLKIGPLFKEQNCKQNVFRTYSIGNIKIIIALLVEIITFYI